VESGKPETRGVSDTSLGEKGSNGAKALYEGEVDASDCWTPEQAERLLIGWARWTWRPFTREQYEELRAAGTHRPGLPRWERIIELLGDSRASAWTSQQPANGLAHRRRWSRYSSCAEDSSWRRLRSNQRLPKPPRVAARPQLRVDVVH
jgi:hypothetical protein